jgi:hypothetical protein
MDVRRQKVVHLVVEKVTFLLAQGDELAYLVEFVFKRQGFLLPGEGKKETAVL